MIMKNGRSGQPFRPFCSSRLRSALTFSGVFIRKKTILRSFLAVRGRVGFGLLFLNGVFHYKLAGLAGSELLCEAVGGDCFLYVFHVHLIALGHGGVFGVEILFGDLDAFEIGDLLKGKLDAHVALGAVAVGLAQLILIHAEIGEILLKGDALRGDVVFELADHVVDRVLDHALRDLRVHQVRELGVDLVGWRDGKYGQRNDDTTSLGDWYVNTKKLTNGITRLSDKIHAMDMMFGIWVEPEMISRRSLLFDSHPDWAVMIPGREPSVGRNQFILDLTRKDVRDYLVRAMSEVFRISKADYVKWDMNRIFSDLYSASGIRMGEFGHRYVMGLYEVFSRLVSAFPKILFEGCASGGNRFDLGVLCFMPQIWTSDNSDACCRTSIQGGTSYAYPVSTMGAHVSASPNHQTLRKTDIESRFNVAAFGILGYEMDLGALNSQQRLAVKDQIAFYKRYRALLQYGRFFRLSDEGANRTRWMVANNDFSEMIVLDFQTLNQSNTGPEVLRIPYARAEFDYELTSRIQKVPISDFGSLINMVSPVMLKADSNLKRIIDDKVMLSSSDEHCIVSGDVLAFSGVRLNPQFSGAGFAQDVRVLGDFGSRLYHIVRIQKEVRK